MAELLYYRRFGIQWKYPELIHGEGKDYRVYNMDRNPESETYGQEKIEWNTDLYPKPTDTEMLSWYNDNKYLIERVYAEFGEQFDRIFHDIENGCLDKTGSFFTEGKKVKDSSKPG